MLRTFVLFLCFGASLHAADKKPPVGPVTEGMSFKGVFKTGTPGKRGVLRKPYVANFELKFVSVDGNAFEGTWTWDGKAVTKVKGKINRKGAITLWFTANIKGKSAAAFDGQATGKVNAETLVLRYVRPSGNRIGLAQGKVSD
jgi:hypothetical protein